MKIISKYKDYYDFCAGKYGIDEKVVYERKSVCHEKPSDGEHFIGFCGVVYRIIIHNEEFIFGDDFEYDSFKHEIKERKPSTGWWDGYIKKHLVTTKKNDEYNCPVVLLNHRLEHVGDNPLLKNYGFNKIMTPEDCWVNVSNWLSREKQTDDNRTDKEKIVGHGFDLKTSFRKL